MKGAVIRHDNTYLMVLDKAIDFDYSEGQHLPESVPVPARTKYFLVRVKYIGYRWVIDSDVNTVTAIIGMWPDVLQQAEIISLPVEHELAQERLITEQAKRYNQR